MLSQQLTWKEIAVYEELPCAPEFLGCSREPRIVQWKEKEQDDREQPATERT